MAAKRKVRRVTKRKTDLVIMAIGRLERRAAAILDEMRSTTSQANSALGSLRAALDGAPRNFLRHEVEAALLELRTYFRDGPVQINQSLVRLAQDILQEQIREVLKDQMRKLADELALIARDER